LDGPKKREKTTWNIARERLGSGHNDRFGVAGVAEAAGANQNSKGTANKALSTDQQVPTMADQQSRRQEQPRCGDREVNESLVLRHEIETKF
jgi:hypothetical protein